MVPVRVPRCGTLLAIDPLANARDIMLFLPDWQSGFRLVDYIAAGIKSSAPVRGRNANDYRAVTQFQQAFTVYTHRMADGKMRKCLIDDLNPFFLASIATYIHRMK